MKNGNFLQRVWNVGLAENHKVTIKFFLMKIMKQMKGMFKLQN